MTLFDQWLGRLVRPVEAAWLRALPSALFDAWWARGCHDRVGRVLERRGDDTAPLLARFAALDFEPARSRRWALKALQARPWSSAFDTAASVVPLTDPDVERALYEACQRREERPSLSQLRTPEAWGANPLGPEEESRSEGVRVWRAARLERAEGEALLRRFWAEPQVPRDMLFAVTAAMNAWHTVPTAARPWVAQTLALRGDFEHANAWLAEAEGGAEPAVLLQWAKAGAVVGERWPRPVDRARIVEAAADLEAQFEEGLIDADELLNEQCVVACATEALAAFSDERLAAGVEAARAWVETLFAAQSQPEVATSEQVRARVLRQVAEAGAKGDVARVCHRLAGLGRAGHRALVREAVAALEGLVGDLSKHGGLARRALTFCPGRSALLAQDDHDDANVIAGLFRDGERERARALAEGLLAFDAAVVFGEDLLALAPVVLHEEREGEQRLREVAEQLVADLPSSLAEVDAPPARATVIHVRAPTHEAKLVEDLEDEASALVFADHLQALGDPRGELVVLLHHRRDYEAREHLRRHSESLLGPLAEYTRRLDGVKGEAFTWRRGFIDAAVLGYSVHHAMAETAAPVSLEGGLEALATHPSGQVLSALVIATNELDDGMHFGPATEVLGRHDWPALRRLRVGRVFSPHDPDTTSADFDYQISWMQLADLRTLWARVPRLEALTVQGALSAPVLVDVSLPRLKSLRLLSGGLAAENTRAVAQADWPSLESLELWFGDAQYGFSGGVRDLSGLLGGARVPRLRSLGLKNAMFADELIEALARSALLARLEVVSLDLGMLSGDGAQVLVRNWPKFAHLRELSLTLNCLTDDDVDQLSGLGDTVVLGDQKDPLAERYVSVGE